MTTHTIMQGFLFFVAVAGGLSSAFIWTGSSRSGHTRPALRISDAPNNYWPTRDRGYYERYLRQLNSKNATVQLRAILGDDANPFDAQSDDENQTATASPHITVKHRIIVEIDDVNPQNEDDEETIEQSLASAGIFRAGNGRRYGNPHAAGVSRAPKSSENFQVLAKSPLTFADIGGYENVKQEMMQCADMLLNREKYAKYNVRVPKGLVLEGPPGNGKTMLAKGFAGEAKTAFIAVSGSQFQEKYVGVGSSRVRELFELARKNAPCVIFIDEMDAIGRHRSGGGEGESATSERDSTLNELLVALDGFQPNTGVFLVGATNRADMLDPALMRPGRIDKRIHIGAPDAATREAILRLHLRGKPYDSGRIFLQDLVEMTSGYSGAQIENVLNEAMLHALRGGRERFEPADLDAIVGKMMVGWQPTEHAVEGDMLDRIAVHELGHAVVAYMSKHHARLVKVVLSLSSPRAPGYTLFEHPEGLAASLYTREALFERLMVLLAGRIAEEEFYEMSATTGASDDFDKASHLATQMVVEYGMGRHHCIYPKGSDKYRELVDDEVAELLQGAYAMAETLVVKYRGVIREGADALKVNRVLKLAELEAIIKRA